MCQEFPTKSFPEQPTERTWYLNVIIIYFHEFLVSNELIRVENSTVKRLRSGVSWNFECWNVNCYTVHLLATEPSPLLTCLTPDFTISSYLTFIFVWTEHFDGANLLEKKAPIHGKLLHFLFQVTHGWIMN